MPSWPSMQRPQAGSHDGVVVDEHDADAGVTHGPPVVAEREAHRHRRPLARGALDLGVAAELGCPIAYAVQPAPTFAARSRWSQSRRVEAPAVVADVQQDLVGLVGEADHGPGRAACSTTFASAPRVERTSAAATAGGTATGSPWTRTRTSRPWPPPTATRCSAAGRAAPVGSSLEVGGCEVAHDPTHLVEPLAGRAPGRGDVLARDLAAGAPSPAPRRRAAG